MRSRYFWTVSRLFGHFSLCFFQLTNLSAMEVNIVRPFFLRALELIDKIDTDPTIEAP